MRRDGRSTRRAFLASALRVAGGLAIASCAPTAPRTGPSAAASAVAVKRGGTIVIANQTDPTTLDSLKNGAVSQRGIMRAIHDPLVDYDPDTGKLRPMLLESWDIPDPKTYVLHLRPGVKFHDGTPFDADALTYHFDRHLDPKNNSLRRTEMLSIDKYAAVDRYTVKVTLRAPYAAFLVTFFDRPGLIMSPTALKKEGEGYATHPTGGAGPFRFVEYVQDDHVTVERNGDYWDTGKPLADRIVFKAVPVDATRLVMVRSGDAHLAEGMPYQDISRIRQMNDVVLSERKGFRYEYVRLNCGKTPTSNADFRQVVNWILDRESIQRSVYFNTGSVGYAPFLPGMPFYDPSYKPFTRDLGKAKALLDKAGIPSSTTFTLYTNEDPVAQRTLEVLQQDFAAVGLTTTIQKEVGAAATARDTKGDWNVLLSWYGQRPDPAQYLATQWLSSSSRFTGLLKDAQLDQLIVSGEQESDLEKRTAIYKALTDRMNTLAEVVFYHDGSDYKGLGPKLRGFVHWPDTLVRYQDLSLSD